MKVVFLTSTFPRFHGDMQANFVGEQAEAWLKARPTDEISIVAPHDSGIKISERVGDLPVERFRYMPCESWQRLAYPAILPNVRRNPALLFQIPLFLLGEYRTARRVAREMNADMFYAHWVMPQGIVAWLLSRSLGIPYVLQNHSSDLSVFLKLGRFGKALARRILRDSRHFFCVNESQRKFAVSLFQEAEQEQFAAKCTVLPMGVAGGLAAKRCGSEEFDIASIGRLSRKKGLHHFIKAAEVLAARGIRPAIGFAGDGEDRAFLESLVERANISFVGFLTGTAKVQFLQKARSFAFPAGSEANDVEGLPVALLEALSSGKPVLASRDTNVEMLPEWQQIRRAVVMVPDPTDVLELANSIEELLGRMPDPKVSEKIKRYRWDFLIQEYLMAVDVSLAQGERSATRR